VIQILKDKSSIITNTTFHLRTTAHRHIDIHTTSKKSSLFSYCSALISQAGILLLFILTADGFLPGGSGTTIRHNTQITLQSNETQHTKLHTHSKGHTTQNEYNHNYNYIN
jgi:hypothetical protein